MVCGKRARDDDNHPVVDQEKWKAARMAVLEKEKEITKLKDEVAKMRQELPWMKLGKEYTLQGAAGPANLKSLFGDHDTLMVYHFMFEPDWERPCKSCSLWMDAINGMLPFIFRKTAFVAVGAASISKMLTQAEIKNWKVPFYSAEGSEFSRDMGVQFTKEEMDDKEFKGYNFGRHPFCAESPGVTVFRLVGQDVMVTYNCFARGLEPLNNIWGILDMLPEGRNEQWPMDWVKHKEDYVSSSDKPDEELVREKLSKWNEAMQRKDTSGLVADVADNVVLYDLKGPPYKIVSKGMYEKDWEEVMPYLPDKMACKHQDLKVTTSGNVAFAYGMHKIGPADATGSSDEESWSRVTMCFEKIGGHWKSVHEHYSQPIDMMTEKAVKITDQDVNNEQNPSSVSG